MTTRTEIRTAVATLAALATFPCSGFGATNLSLGACDAAAEITGADRTFCRMLNLKFRTDAAALMFQRASGLAA